MQGLGAVLTAAFQFLQVELTIDGLTFSLWQIFLWSIVAGVIIYLVVLWVSK